MPAVRDPLSVKFDTAVRRVLTDAIRAHRVNPRQPRAARMWIRSPGREFRDLDDGGRTATERAFTRSVYWHTFKVPRKLGVRPDWSAKLEWSHIENHHGRYGRYVRVRLFTYSSGARHVERKVATPWIEDEQGYAGLKSMAGNRIDQRRQAAG